MRKTVVKMLKKRANTLWAMGVPFKSKVSGKILQNSEQLYRLLKREYVDTH